MERHQRTCALPEERKKRHEADLAYQAAQVVVKKRHTRKLKKRIRRVTRTVHMTQERLDAALKVLEDKTRQPQPYPKWYCFRAPNVDDEKNEFPLMSLDRHLWEMQKCIDMEDWQTFTKYMLHLGPGHMSENFHQAHYKFATVGLTYDPLAREHNLLAEFVENLRQNVPVWKNESLSLEEATRKIFAIL